MAFNLGINVYESDGRSAPALQGAPTSVAGLLVRSSRGPVERAVRVSNYQQFLARFGDLRRDSVSAYCVEGFFLNGGREAHVARIVGLGAVPAAAAIPANESKTVKPVTALAVKAGFRGGSDPGQWGNLLAAEIAPDPLCELSLAPPTPAGLRPAKKVGAALASGVIDLSPHGTSVPRTISVNVAGEAGRTLSLDELTLPDPRRATLSDILDAINKSPLGEVVIAFLEDIDTPNTTGKAIALITRKKGAALKLNDAPHGTLALLSLNDVEALAPSASGPQAFLYLTSRAGLKEGDVIRVSDQLTSEYAKIKTIAGEEVEGRYLFKVTLEQPLVGSYELGRYNNNRATVATCEFSLTVLSLATPGRPLALERFRGLTLDPSQSNYAPNLVNDPDTGSCYVQIVDGYVSGGARPAFDPVPQSPIPGQYALGMGVDGDEPQASDYRAALRRFDLLSIQLLSALVAPERGTLKSLTRACLDYCEGRGDCLFVGHTFDTGDPEAAKGFGREYQGSKVYGALYWPWISVVDPLGIGSNPTLWIPPTGHVLGVYARTEQSRGIWKAPAGNESVIRGALAVRAEVTEVDNTDLVKVGSVNTVRRLPGTGIVIDASRTLSTDTRWLYVNVRLLFNFVKVALREGLRWVKQEPNREELWNKIKYNVVTPFLLGLYRQGAFGPGKAEDTFSVICGAENNSPAEIQQGILHLDVYFYPSRPAETIIIQVGQQEGRSSAGER